MTTNLAMKRADVPVASPEATADRMMTAAEKKIRVIIAAALQGISKPDGTFENGIWTPHPAHFNGADADELRKAVALDVEEHCTRFRAHKVCKSSLHAWRLADVFLAGGEIPPKALEIAQRVDQGKIRARFAEAAIEVIAREEKKRQTREAEAAATAFAKTPQGRAQIRLDAANAALEKLNGRLKKLERLRASTLNRIKTEERRIRAAQKVLAANPNKEPVS